MARTKIEVRQFNQEDKGFWTLMGRWFASAQVKRDLGIAMNSDETYTWFLAFINGELAGFCALVPAKNHTDLKHVYVLPGHEEKGIEKQVVSAAVTAGKKPFKATVRQEELPFYQKFEFTKVGDRGQYVQIVKE